MNHYSYELTYSFSLYHLVTLHPVSPYILYNSEHWIFKCINNPILYFLSPINDFLILSLTFRKNTLYLIYLSDPELCLEFTFEHIHFCLSLPPTEIITQWHSLLLNQLHNGIAFCLINYTIDLLIFSNTAMWIRIAYFQLHFQLLFENNGLFLMNVQLSDYFVNSRCFPLELL